MSIEDAFIADVYYAFSQWVCFIIKPELYPTLNFIFWNSHYFFIIYTYSLKFTI